MSIAPITASSTTNTQLSIQQQFAGQSQPLHQSGDTRISTLTIGGVEFADFEIPEKIGVFGGKQIVIVHEFVGGLRQLQALGAQPEKLSWSGIMMGGDPNVGAKARAAMFDSMRVSGQLVYLQWGQFKFQVIISAFHIEPQTDWMIPYNMECEIQQDLSQGALLPSSVPGTDASFQSLINSALNVNSILPNISIDAPNATVFSAAISNVQQVQQLWNGQVAAMSQASQYQASNLLTQSILSLVPIAQGSIQFDAAAANSMIAQMQNMHNIMQGFTGNPPNLTSVINPNLFDIAAVQYGDVTQWPTLASLNNLPQQPLQSGVFPSFVLSK